MSFLNNGKPIGYGAIMYNGSASGMAHSYPFFTSQPNISALPGVDMSGNATTINVAEVDDYWLVMPGYKLELFDYTSYNTLLFIYDNTTGITPVNNVLSPNYNKVSSLKLYYKNVLL